MRILCTFLEGSQRDLLLAVDFEEGVQPRDLKEVRHSLVDLGKFHLASPLPDDAIASNEFAHAIAVYVIHSGEIEQEFLVAGVGEDVYQVTQLRATIAQREFANSVNYNDSVELSCGDLKTHGDFAKTVFSRAESYIPWPWRFNAITFRTQSMSAMGMFRQRHRPKAGVIPITFLD